MKATIIISNYHTNSIVSLALNFHVTHNQFSIQQLVISFLVQLSCHIQFIQSVYSLSRYN